LPRLPIGAVGYRAGIDNVAIRRLFERDKRMILFQAVLNNRRIVLVDFATQGCNGNLHVFAAQRISNLTFQTIWRLRIVIAPRYSRIARVIHPPPNNLSPR
jgi:hypothetical protein